MWVEVYYVSTELIMGNLVNEDQIRCTVWRRSKKLLFEWWGTEPRKKHRNFILGDGSRCLFSSALMIPPFSTFFTNFFFQSFSRDSSLFFSFKLLLSFFFHFISWNIFRKSKFVRFAGKFFPSLSWSWCLYLLFVLFFPEEWGCGWNFFISFLRDFFPPLIRGFVFVFVVSIYNSSTCECCFPLQNP